MNPDIEESVRQRDDTEHTTISKAQTLEEVGDFWDNHSLADYWDETQEVDFKVRATRRGLVTLDPELYSEIAAEATFPRDLSRDAGQPVASRTPNYTMA